MVDKITLANIASFQNDTSAIAQYNSNNALIITAFNNTLSRDGTSPNQMVSSLDMNNNQIINLPAPSNINSPVRLVDIATNPTVVVPPTGISGHTVPYLDGINTWSGNNSFNISGITPAINVLQSPMSGTYPNTLNMNTFFGGTDNINASAANVLNHYTIAFNIGGSSMQGARTMLYAPLTLTASTSASNTNRNYVAIQPAIFANASDNGTPGTPAGSFFGLNTTAKANTGATGLLAVTGEEIDFGLLSGSSSKYLFGHALVNIGDTHAGGGGFTNAVESYLIFYNGNGAISGGGLNNGIQFGLTPGSYPVSSTGTVINNIAATVDTFIDASLLTISTAAFKSPGFTVSGVGVITAGTNGGTGGSITLKGATSGSTTISVTGTGSVLSLSGGNTVLDSSANFITAGSITLNSIVAVPSGGTTGVGLKMSSTANLGVFFGSSTPTLSAAKGSLYLRTDGTTTNNRAYINTDGGTTWTALTTVA